VLCVCVCVYMYLHTYIHMCIYILVYTHIPALQLNTTLYPAEGICKVSIERTFDEWCLLYSSNRVKPQTLNLKPKPGASLRYTSYLIYILPYLIYILPYLINL
jgi:hypothetical protein